MLEIEELRKEFMGHDGQLVKATDGINLSIKAGKLYTILGPSGCGKTTALRSIAGLEKPDSGVIKINNVKVFDSSNKLFIPPNERGIGMVFQSYAIWPHMNVYQNVAFPLKQMRPRISSKEISQRVEEVLQNVHLGGYEKRGSTKLSGGQQQRLALARAIVHRPKLLLLDEPLSNLDAKLREKMRFEIKKLQRDLGITTVYVTHDQDEALALSDEIVVMNGGRIVQIGSPKEIYYRPSNKFVADFIGLTNFISGTVQDAAQTGLTQYIHVGPKSIQCTFSDDVAAGTEVLVSIRPENITVTKQSIPGTDENVLEGQIENRVFLGQYIDYIVKVAGTQEIRVRCHPDQDFEVGENVYLNFHTSKCIVLSP